MSLGRSLAISLAGLVVATLTYPIYIVIVGLVAFSNMPSQCGFDASDMCTNPDANNAGIFVFALLVYVIFIAAVSWLLHAAVIERGVRRARANLSQRSLWVFSTLLAVIPAAAGLVVWADSSGSLSFAAAAAVFGAVVWGVALRRVARPNA